MITLQNPLGTISMNADYFAELVSLAARSCYGVAGMATGGAQDDFKSLFFGSDFPEKGVRVTQHEGKLTIELHIKVGYGLNIATIVQSITHKVKHEVENATGVPTLVGNDTNAALVAERFFGDCSPNSMLISIGRGVGAALCLNDVIIEGSSSTAGEIAHVVVDPNGPTCECGKRGCLESLVSDDRLQERIAQNPASRTRILAEAGALLGRVMAIPAGLLDLRDISIYGAPEIVNAQFIDAMEDEIRRTMTTDYQKAPQIHRCRQGEDLTLRGQATIVIRTLVPTIHERGSLIGDA